MDIVNIKYTEFDSDSRFVGTKFRKKRRKTTSQSREMLSLYIWEL